MALQAEEQKMSERKKLSEEQRNALHAQMEERETLKREVISVLDFPPLSSCPPFPPPPPSPIFLSM